MCVLKINNHNNIIIGERINVMFSITISFNEVIESPGDSLEEGGVRTTR